MVNRVILLALLVSMMSPISSLAADLKPADKRNYELQQQISYNVIIPPEAFETSADGTLIVPIEIKTDDKGNIVAVEAGPNNWKLDREAYPIFEEAAKEAAWNTKHVDTDEALVVTIPVSIVMLSLEKYTYELLAERGVTLEDIAELVFYVQKPYMPNLKLEECRTSVASVLSKREVHNAIITGIELDKLTEQNKLSQPLQRIVANDESLYGIDEILAFSIVNLYGSIGFTNYGYLDKVKPGIIKKLDSEEGGRCNTFLDDLVGAVAAAAAGKLAHNEPNRVQHAIVEE